MVLSVVHRYLDIDDGVAVDAAGCHRLHDALLNRGDELPWNRSALDLVYEREPLTRRHRTDDEVADAVLPMASRLLFVPALSVGAPRDCFPVRDSHRLLCDRHPELSFELLDGDEEVCLAHAVEQRLMRLIASLQFKRRIFVEDAMQR